METPLIEERARAARAAGAECVVVLGLGFVGTAVAANLSRTRGQRQEPLFFVIGLDLDAARAGRPGRGPRPDLRQRPEPRAGHRGRLPRDQEPGRHHRPGGPAARRRGRLVHQPRPRARAGPDREPRLPHRGLRGGDAHGRAPRASGDAGVPSRARCRSGCATRCSTPPCARASAPRGSTPRPTRRSWPTATSASCPGRTTSTRSTTTGARTPGSTPRAPSARGPSSRSTSTSAKFPLWRHKSTRAGGDGQAARELLPRRPTSPSSRSGRMLAEEAGVDLFDVIALDQKR